MFRRTRTTSIRGRAASGSSRRRDHRGAVAIEAAFVTPVLLLLVFGIIEFGLVFKDWLAVTSSVRAGARIASAEPRISTFAQDAADQVAREGGALNMSDVTALWVYKADSAGFPVGGGGSFSNCTVCVKFSWNSSTKKFQPISNTWPSTAQNACQGDSLHDTVGVYLAINHPGVTGLIFKNLSLTSHTAMSLEPIPVTRSCK